MYYMTNFSSNIHISIIMKKFFAILLILLPILLCGCKKKWHQVSYEFENFHWYFLSENYYKQSMWRLSWLWYQLLENDIINMYSQQEASGFINSIIITKRNSDQDLNWFINENLDLIKNSSFKTEWTNQSKFICNKVSYNIVTTKSKIKANLNTIYLSQSFFKKDGYIYTISLATQDIKERNNFESNIKKLSCN